MGGAPHLDPVVPPLPNPPSLPVANLFTTTTGPSASAPHRAPLDMGPDSAAAMAMAPSSFQGASSAGKKGQGKKKGKSPPASRDVKKASRLRRASSLWLFRWLEVSPAPAAVAARGGPAGLPSGGQRLTPPPSLGSLLPGCGLLAAAPSEPAAVTIQEEDPVRGARRRVLDTVEGLRC